MIRFAPDSSVSAYLTTILASVETFLAATSINLDIVVPVKVATTDRSRASSRGEISLARYLDRAPTRSAVPGRLLPHSYTVETLLHEVGHLVYDAIPGQIRRAWDRPWEGSIVLLDKTAPGWREVLDAPDPAERRRLLAALYAQIRDHKDWQPRIEEIGLPDSGLGYGLITEDEGFAESFVCWVCMLDCGAFDRVDATLRAAGLVG